MRIKRINNETPRKKPLGINGGLVLGNEKKNFIVHART